MKKFDETALAILLKSYMMKAMTREEAKATIGQIVVVCKGRNSNNENTEASIGTAINVEKLAEVMDDAILWGRDYLSSQDSSADGYPGYPMLTDMRKYIRDDLLERVTGDQFANNLSDCIVDLIMSWYWFSRD